jgi:hypothetical protein
VSALYNDSIEVLRAPLVANQYRDEKRNWGAASATPYDGVNMQPLQVPLESTEYTEDRQTTVTRYLLITQRGMDIDLLETDRVAFAGMTFEVDGKVGRWPAPGGGLRHVEARLKEID